MTTFLEASDDVLALFKAGWDTTAFASNVVYENMPPPDGVTIPPADDAPYVRVFIRNLSGHQDSLVGEVGNRSFVREAIFTAHLMIRAGDSMEQGYTLGQVIVDAFEGQTTPNCVWFRDVSLMEMGPDGDYYAFHVTARFQYTEVK